MLAEAPRFTLIKIEIEVEKLKISPRPLNNYQIKSGHSLIPSLSFPYFPSPVSCSLTFHQGVMRHFDADTDKIWYIICPGETSHSVVTIRKGKFLLKMANFSNMYRRARWRCRVSLIIVSCCYLVPVSGYSDVTNYQHMYGHTSNSWHLGPNK